MAVIEILQYSLAVFMVALLGYQLVLSILLLKGEKGISLKANRNRHFAIIMPPPKDGRMISKSLYSVFGLVYPKNLYDVIVIDDNLDENAVNTAREMGAVVLHRNGSKNENLHELQWAFEEILQGEKNYDALLVVESDSFVSGNYLDVMNYYLDNGSNVIQSSNLMLAQPSDEGNGIRDFLKSIYNFLKPLGRKVLGFSRGLRNNGICFTTKILRNNPWLTGSLTNDVGYGLMLQLKGINIDFVHEAILWTEMSPENHSRENGQKKWDMNRLSIIKNYAPKLLKATFQYKSLSYFFSFLDLITPSLLNILVIAIGLSIVNILMWLVAGWSLSLVWVWLFVATLGLGHVYLGMYTVNTYRKAYQSVR